MTAVTAQPGVKEIDRALSRLTISGELEMARPAVEALVSGLEEQVRLKVFRALNGEAGLTPHDALVAWVQFHAFSLLRTRLTQALNVGQSAGKTLEDVMKPNGG